MKGYYEQLQKAHLDINNLVQTTVIGQGQELDIEKAIYDLTITYAVSEKAIRARFDQILKIYSNLRAVDGKLFAVE